MPAQEEKSNHFSFIYDELIKLIQQNPLLLALSAKTVCTRAMRKVSQLWPLPSCSLCLEALKSSVLSAVHDQGHVAKLPFSAYAPTQFLQIGVVARDRRASIPGKHFLKVIAVL